MNTAQKAETFRALHAAPGSFVIANAWDAGSAKLLRGLGFPALATSSGAQAGVLGRIDGAVSRDEAAPYVEKLLSLEPNFTIEKFRKEYPFKRPQDRDVYCKGLRLAGIPKR